MIEIYRQRRVKQEVDRDKEHSKNFLNFLYEKRLKKLFANYIRTTGAKRLSRAEPSGVRTILLKLKEVVFYEQQFENF